MKIDVNIPKDSWKTLILPGNFRDGVFILRGLVFYFINTV